MLKEGLSGLKTIKSNFVGIYVYCKSFKIVELYNFLTSHIQQLKNSAYVLKRGDCWANVKSVNQHFQNGRKCGILQAKEKSLLTKFLNFSVIFPFFADFSDSKFSEVVLTFFAKIRPKHMYCSTNE